jgi:putative ABC transport system permease protein
MRFDGFRRALRLPLDARKGAARVASDVDDEIAFHLAMREAQLRAAGMTEDEARAEARRRFGDAARTASECRRAGETHVRVRASRELVSATMQDLGFAVRGLRRTPLFGAVAMLTLALGLGATTSVFSVVSAVLLRPLPYDGADRIVRLGEAPAAPSGETRRIMSTSWPNADDWRRAARSFEAVGVFNGWEPALTGEGAPEVLRGALVTAGVFDVFRVAPAAGRPMLDADNLPGSEPIVLLSHGFWTRRFGGDASVVGRRLMLNGVPRTVVGVLPAAFHGPGVLGGDVWANNTFDASDTRTARYLQAVARLVPGVSLDAAQVELRAISARLAAEHPAENGGLRAVAVPLRESVSGDARLPLLVLLGASGLVLVLACANVANLLVARGLARGRELAIRVALGAGRMRVVRQLLAESMLLAFSGAALGAALAAAATRVMMRMAPEVVRSQPVTADARVLGFAVAAAALTGVLAGLLPAWRATRVHPRAVLADGGRGTATGRALRARDALAVVQLALALALLANAALLAKSFARLERVDPGIRPEGVLVASINLPAAKYPAGREPAFHAALLERVRAISGVSSAAVTSTVPFNGNTDLVSVDVVGRPARLGADRMDADRFIVSADYFRTMGVTLRAGRLITEADGAGGRRVAIVDEIFARRLVRERGTPDESPIGLRIDYGDTATVVGVVGTVKHDGLDVASGGQLYLSAAQKPWRWVSVVVRAERPEQTTALVPSLRGAVRAVDPDQPIFGVTTVEDLMRERTASRRFVLALVTAFTGVALVLAVVGLYGVMAYGVAQRRRELGIRLALGAGPSRLRWTVLRGGLALAGCGVAAGLAVAVAVSRSISGLLFEVRATDPAVLASVAIALVAVAALASYAPARRAAATSPQELLRDG